MEAAIRSLSETLTGFLGVDAAGAVTGDDDNEPALVTRLSAVAGAAAEAFAASTATPPALEAPSAYGIWAFGNAASQCRAADDALTEALIAGLARSDKGAEIIDEADLDAGDAFSGTGGALVKAMRAATKARYESVADGDVTAPKAEAASPWCGERCARAATKQDCCSGQAPPRTRRTPLGPFGPPTGGPGWARRRCSRRVPCWSWRWAQPSQWTH